MMVRTTKSLVAGAVSRLRGPYTKMFRKYENEQGYLEAFAATHSNVTFLQIGAHDGKTDDHLRTLILAQNWRGILVEPVPYLYGRLVENYRGNPQLTFVNKAIADAPGTRPFYRLRQNDDGLPHWYDQLGSFDRDVVLKHENAIPNIASYLITEMVECISPNALLREYNVERLDLLLVDTEGYDFEVLKAIDFTAHLPALIVYEWKHLSSADVTACRERLWSFGYRNTQLATGNCVAILAPTAARLDRLATNAKGRLRSWLDG